MTALFLTTDLMFSSRVLGAAGTIGVPLAICGSPENLLARSAAEPDLRLVLIDLTHPADDLSDLVTRLRAQRPQVRVVAFGPHVDSMRLHAAQAAGCDEVLTRGQFQQTYVERLRALAAPAASQGSSQQPAS